ncbi:hypothetical protein ACE6H2_017218 [Prunus campanulata]
MRRRRLDLDLDLIVVVRGPCVCKGGEGYHADIAKALLLVKDNTGLDHGNITPHALICIHCQLDVRALVQAHILNRTLLIIDATHLPTAS